MARLASSYRAGRRNIDRGRIDRQAYVHPIVKEPLVAKRVLGNAPGFRVIGKNGAINRRLFKP